MISKLKQEKPMASMPSDVLRSENKVAKERDVNRQLEATLRERAEAAEVKLEKEVKRNAKLQVALKEANSKLHDRNDGANDDRNDGANDEITEVLNVAEEKQKIIEM